MEASGNKLRRSILWYYGIAVLVGVVTYFVSMFIARSAPATPCYADTKTVAEATAACVGANVLEWGLRALVWLALSVGSNVFARRLINKRSDNEFKKEMHTPDNNDSPAWINAAWYITVAFMVWAVPFVSWDSFLAFVFLRAAITAVVVGIVTMFLLWYRCGIQNTYDFVMLVQTKGTNSVAIWMLTGLVCGVLLVR